MTGQNDEFWPGEEAFQGPRQMVRPDAVDSGPAESPSPGVPFVDWLENIGAVEPDVIIEDGHELAEEILKHGFRAGSNKQQVNALADVLAEYSQILGRGRRRMRKGWDTFKEERRDEWGAFVTPRNVADQFESWLIRNNLDVIDAHRRGDCSEEPRGTPD